MRTFFALMLMIAAIPVAASQIETSAGTVKVDPVLTGLVEPWGIGFLPEGGVLVTERGGRLLHLTQTGELLTVKGTPNVAARGQGGLLDIMIPRDFSQTREVFMTYSEPQSGGAGTALASARLSDDGRQLTGLRTIFEMAPGSSGGRHFGSRVVEGADGSLFVTIGDRGDRPSAQDLGRHNGSVVRIKRDGSVPADNPFVGQSGAQPEIWSYGHRNPQGAALDASGQLWTVEHGAQGGDEVNKIMAGANYGWPVISYGRHYSGRRIGDGTAKPGMEQPEFYWDPSIAPSGMMIYSGKLWQEWRGDMFIGSLKFDYISRLEGPVFKEVEQIEGDVTARVRAIAEAPDGAIWFLSVNNDALFRMTPAQAP